MADIYSTWDGTFQGNTNVLDIEKEFLVKYPASNSGQFKLIFRVKPNPIGFIWRK